MGGLDPAREYVERAIERKRGVVTANKALLAACGGDLVERATAAGVDLAFEASVGGGIPIIRTLREALASDWVTSLAGIVNGTCNFVLTRMRDHGDSFDAAVKTAQELGFAEADPELDVGGHDAAHKLVVLAMLAFGARVDVKDVPTEGIRALEPIDHASRSASATSSSTRDRARSRRLRRAARAPRARARRLAARERVGRAQRESRSKAARSGRRS